MVRGCAGEEGKGKKIWEGNQVGEVMGENPVEGEGGLLEIFALTGEGTAGREGAAHERGCFVTATFGRSVARLSDGRSHAHWTIRTKPIESSARQTYSVQFTGVVCLGTHLL